MRYDHGSRENRQRATFLLGTLKPRLIDASSAVEEATTMQAATSSPHSRISNVACVHVYRTSEEWNGDSSLKDLPTGVPDVIGNVVPCGSRHDALESAIGQPSSGVQREKVLSAVVHHRRRSPKEAWRDRGTPERMAIARYCRAR